MKKYLFLCIKIQQMNENPNMSLPNQKMAEVLELSRQPVPEKTPMGNFVFNKKFSKQQDVP